MFNRSNPMLDSQVFIPVRNRRAEQQLADKANRQIRNLQQQLANVQQQLANERAAVQRLIAQRNAWLAVMRECHDDESDVTSFTQNWGNRRQQQLYEQNCRERGVIPK